MNTDKTPACPVCRQAGAGRDLAEKSLIFYNYSERNSRNKIMCLFAKLKTKIYILFFQIHPRLSVKSLPAPAWRQTGQAGVLSVF